MLKEPQVEVAGKVGCGRSPLWVHGSWVNSLIFPMLRGDKPAILIPSKLMSSPEIPRMCRSNCLLVIFVFTAAPLVAQDRLKTMPGYEQYARVSKEIPGSVSLGYVNVVWKDDGKAFEFRKAGKLMRYHIASRELKEVGDAKKDPLDPKKVKPGKNPPVVGPCPARGRQFTSALAPGGKLKAVYADHNLYLSNPAGGDITPVTTDGNAKTRVKYGTASWVYGEELYQNTAIWWSPDGKRLAYYRFDESKVPDYYLQLDHMKVQSRMDIEPYPKAGAPNPVVDLCIYDLDTKKSLKVDVRDGQPFTDAVIGHYVYHVSWSPDGKELHFYRTNRKQNIMEFAAANPETGACRVIVREEWLPSWVANLPTMRYLADQRRSRWMSERTGWKNYYLYDLAGKLHGAVTSHKFEAGSILRVDDKAGVLYYMARSGDNPMKLQLHRGGLDGQNDKRLTDPAFHHTVDIAPDGKHFIDTIQTHASPPVSRLVDAEGNVITELAKSDMTKFHKLGLKSVELLTYKAGDGKTDLYGLLYRPSNFDPAKKYPLLVRVYAGPETNGASEGSTLPSALAEFGFLVATLDARTAAGRGKHFLDSIYGRLGIVEIDDQAAGVKSLWDRPYLDKNRVGIFGASYGGYASILCMFRSPDVFQAACASSPVTDYRLYDSIYTERYMDLPQTNKKGYDGGSALTYAGKMRGRLMIFFGTADDNVHPANSMQLISALQKAGKSFDLQIGPDQGHTTLSQPRMM